MKAKFRTQFDTPPRIKVLCTEEEKKTKSEFQDDTDINKIMARYKKTGMLPVARAAAQRFGDFSQVPSFTEMQHKIIAAHEMFDALPAVVRRQFGNDPGAFLAAADTQEGRELLKKLGLGAEVEPEPTPSPAAPVAGGQPAPKEPEAPTPTKKVNKEE